MGGGGGCCVSNCCKGRVWQAIKDFFCSNSCCVGNSVRNQEGVDSRNADLEATLRIQKSLDEFRADTQNKSTELENSIIKESRESLDNFINELRAYNKIKYGNRKLDINLSNIEREHRKTEDQIHGFIVKRIAKRISLDDDECHELLKLNPGAEKTKKLDDFYKKVLKEAINELTSVLRDAMEKQTDIVEDRIQQRIDSILDICETKTADFEIIQKMKTKDESKIEREQIRLSHYVALCDLGLSLID